MCVFRWRDDDVNERNLYIRDGRSSFGVYFSSFFFLLLEKSSHTARQTHTHHAGDLSQGLFDEKKNVLKFARRFAISQSKARNEFELDGKLCVCKGIVRLLLLLSPWTAIRLALVSSISFRLVRKPTGLSSTSFNFCLVNSSNHVKNYVDDGANRRNMCKIT